MKVCNSGSDLADENWEKEVVDEEGFRVEAEVVAEEEVREEDDDELVWRVREAAAKHFQAANHDDRSRSTKNEERKIFQNLKASVCKQ